MTPNREAASGPKKPQSDPAMSTTQPGMVDFDKYRKLGAYHWKLVETMPDYRQRVMTVCSYVRPGQRCLDLGCGDGTYMHYVADSGGIVTGVDGDADGIRLAQLELERRQVKGFRLIHSVFHELPSKLIGEEGSFDFIYSMDCIEHLIDPGELLGVIDRYLAPDGTFLIGTPLFAGDEFVSTYHVKEYTRAEIEALIQERFEKLGEHLLDAPLPNVRGLVARFYVFHGRRKPRWWQLWRRRSIR